MTKIKTRPTETVSGLGAGLALYGFVTQIGLPDLVAAIIALAAVLVPFVVSEVVDILKPHEPGVASDELLDPSVKAAISKGSK